MSSRPTESSNSHEEALGGVSSFSAASPNAPDVPDKSASLSSGNGAPLQPLERDESDTLTLSTVVAVTNEPTDEANDSLASQKAIPEEEIETATLPALAAVNNNSAPEDEESETATLPSVAALEEELEAESTTKTTLPKTALWTAVSVENKEALTTQKEKKAIHTLNTRVWSAIPKEGAQEQATAHQTPVEEGILHTAVWPTASRSAPPPPAPTAVYPSVSSTQPVILTISRSRAILLTFLISFFNILLGVLIVLALLYQLNGSLIYQSPVLEVGAKVTQLERQASQLASEVEALQERTRQLEAQQEGFEEATRQIERWQDEQNNVQTDLKQAQNEIATLEEESDELQQELTEVVERVTLFDGFLAELQALLQEVRLYQSRPLR